jgi:photosystem II stability/assembly factor-like uncharacterized protein
MGRNKPMQSVFYRLKRSMRNLALTVLMAVAVVPATLQFSAGQLQGAEHDLLSVFFLNEKEGWACGRWGTILFTSDGGKRWDPQKSNADYTLTDIHFIDAKNGWAVGDQGLIIHTKDGGATWEKQESPVTSYLMGVQFVSRSKGWIVTERTTILHTNDGGVTWRVQFKDEDFILRSLSFCDDQNGWAVGEYGFTYHTSDGGNTWEHQAGEYKLSWETMSMEGGNFLFDVIAVDPKTAWVVGIDGYVARTEDGGENWIQVVDGIPKRHLFGVTSDAIGNIFICGDNALLRKSSGLSRFENLKAVPDITYSWLFRLAPRGTKGLVTIGKNGWIYAGNSNGSVWRKMR